MAAARYWGSPRDAGPMAPAETVARALPCGHVRPRAPGAQLAPRSIAVADDRRRSLRPALPIHGWQPEGPMRPSLVVPRASVRRLAAPMTTPRHMPPGLALELATSARSTCLVRSTTPHGAQPQASLADALRVRRPIVLADHPEQTQAVEATKNASLDSKASPADPSTRASSARSISSGSSAAGVDADDVGAHAEGASCADACTGAPVGSGVLCHGPSGAVRVRPPTRSPPVGASPNEAEMLVEFLRMAEAPAMDVEFARPLIRAVRMLWSCNYASEDVCCILAHASIYFQAVLAACDGQMGFAEQGNVLIALVYLAHTWVVDETCSLGIWHEQLFREYCTLPTLNFVVFRLLELRGFSLRVEEEDLLCRHRVLLQALAKTTH